MRWGAGGRLVLGLLAISLVASACSEGDAAPSGATVPKTLPSTTTTTIDITVVPDEITVAYADAVMDELDALLGEAIRELVRARGPNERFYNLLNAVYDDPEFEDQQSVFGEIAAQDMAGMKQNPGDPVTSVVEILVLSDQCLLLDVKRDFAPVLESPQGDDIDGFIALALKQPASDASDINPTPWSVVFDGDTVSRQPPAGVC